MARQKAQYPEDFKTMFGVSTMWLGQVVGGGLVTGYLMLYITDYLGLYTGIAGKAAAVATLMLLLGRIWDAVNDPLLGFLMDRSPRTKWGRFKPFVFIATPVSTLLLIALFNIPAGASDITKVALLYILYFLFDSVFTLLPLTPLTQSLSNDARVRGKLTAAPRVVSLIISMTTGFFIAIAIMLGKDGVTPNIGLAVIVFMLPLAILSMLGVALVKEGRNNADEEKVGIKDVLAMVKVNKPMWIYLIGSLFAGFVWTFMLAGQAYYVKYSFGAENFGTQTAILGLLMIVSLILGTFVSQWVLKIKGMTPGILYMVSYAAAIVPLVILWLINLAGPITNVAIFYPLLFLAFLGVGMSFVPGRLVSMECMDFNKDKIGKSMEGTLAAFFLFTEKVQSALAAALTGVILIAVGYNAELYKDATTIPAELFTGLGFVMFGLPAILGLIAVVIFFFYPLRKKSKRDEMYAEIEARKLAAAASSDIPAE
jgi:Na+/melibiose symporter-like transporter